MSRSLSAAPGRLLRHVLSFRVLLFAGSAALVVGALAVVFQSRPAAAQPTPLPVAANEDEVAWLYVANNAASWERFVAAVQQAGELLRADQPDLEVEAGPAAFPQESTAVPQVALHWRDADRRLVFRWYKLTGNWKARDWVDALTRRDPPPLAVIGGSSSDGARDVATQLQRAAAPLPEARRPLLLLTTATADRIFAPEEKPGESPGVELNRLYPGRTFRFCFTNRQMATAVTRFVWEPNDLRPQADPVLMVQWDDDSYSRDLLGGFEYALRMVVAQAAARDWAWLAGYAAAGAPTPLGGNLPGVHLRATLSQQFIESSVGTFQTPNYYEMRAARYLLEALEHAPAERRHMLIVAGQFQPSRRFLQSLARIAPEMARRLVIASGDPISFNSVYRDRMALWRTQDLPYPLVFFCHRNPIDAKAGFDPADGKSTGTEDVLLFRDIVEALGQALRRDGRPGADAAALREALAAVRVSGGRFGYDPRGVLLFKDDGNRRGSTGEHVVCLRPEFKGDYVLPEASLEVWSWHAEVEGGRPVWQSVGKPLRVSYDDPAAEGGTTP